MDIQGVGLGGNSDGAGAAKKCTALVVPMPETPSQAIPEAKYLGKIVFVRYAVIHQILTEVNESMHMMHGDTFVPRFKLG